MHLLSTIVSLLVAGSPHYGQPQPELGALVTDIADQTIASSLFACASGKASEDKLVSLDSLRWKYRVILVFAREPLADNARSDLHELAAEIEERDIVWFVLDTNTLHTNYGGEVAENLRKQLADRYFTPVPSDTAVLLIGKDGGVKSRSSDLDLEATFGLIDRMPMRRDEIRRKRVDQNGKTMGARNGRERSIANRTNYLIVASHNLHLRQGRSRPHS